jgi:hypothetical protein
MPTNGSVGLPTPTPTTVADALSRRCLIGRLVMAGSSARSSPRTNQINANFDVPVTIG